MSKPVANLVVGTDTFQAWLDRTNLLAGLLSTEVITANSSLGVTTGNAHIEGRLSSNVLIAASSLRGGNTSTSNTLVITSNVAAGQHLTVANTLTVGGSSQLNTVNAASLDISSIIRVGNNLTINTSAFFAGNSSANVKITPNDFTLGNVYANSTTLVIGATVINSSTLGESSNNSNYLDSHNWESPKEIGIINPNTATFTTVTTGKIVANGQLGTSGQILKANSTGGIYFSTGGEGYTGSLGYSGSVGFTGSVGIQGGTGFTGSRGSDGSSGTPGVDGYTGSVGNDGSPGGRGYTGSIGALGFTGSVGVGQIGYTGSGSGGGGNGYTGSRGVQGDFGFTGSRGADGSFGGTVTADLNLGNAYKIGNTASLGVGTTSPTSTGDIRATGNITGYYSDERLKDIFENIPNALDKVLYLNGFFFSANKLAQSLGYEVKREVGVSAQQVQKILPEAVTTAPISDEYLTVYYEKLVPLLNEAIKELNEKIDAIR